MLTVWIIIDMHTREVPDRAEREKEKMLRTHTYSIETNSDCYLHSTKSPTVHGVCINGTRHGKGVIALLIALDGIKSKGNRTQFGAIGLWIPIVCYVLAAFQ